MIPECKLPSGPMRQWHDWPLDGGPCRACGAPRGPGANPPTAAQEEAIAKGLDEGRPTRVIAEEAGVGRSTVQRRKRERAERPAEKEWLPAAPVAQVSPSGDLQPTDGRSPVQMLVDLIREAGAVVTFDPERSWNQPCFCCKAPPPHDLIALGRYPAGDPRGGLMERPLCRPCREVLGRVTGRPHFP